MAHLKMITFDGPRYWQFELMDTMSYKVANENVASYLNDKLTAVQNLRVKQRKGFIPFNSMYRAFINDNEPRVIHVVTSQTDRPIMDITYIDDEYDKMKDIKDMNLFELLTMY